MMPYLRLLYFLDFYRAMPKKCVFEPYAVKNSLSMNGSSVRIIPTIQDVRSTTCFISLSSSRAKTANRLQTISEVYTLHVPHRYMFRSRHVWIESERERQFFHIQMYQRKHERNVGMSNDRCIRYWLTAELLSQR